MKPLRFQLLAPCCHDVTPNTRLEQFGCMELVLADEPLRTTVERFDDHMFHILAVAFGKTKANHNDTQVLTFAALTEQQRRPHPLLHID